MTPRPTPRLIPRPPPGLTRGERLLLAAAALRGAVGGAVRAVLGRLLEHYTL